MKLNQPQSQVQGSFGIPKHMREHLEKAQQAKYEDERPKIDSEEDRVGPVPELKMGADDGFVTGDDEETAADKRLKGPLEVLKELGVPFSEEDAHDVIFRGYIEKEIVVFPAMGGRPAVRYSFKTLTGQELDLVDELLAEEIKETRMTQDGYTTRRNMWILSFGLVKANGNDLPRVTTKGRDGVEMVDLHATARARREALSRMNSWVITLLMRTHTKMALAINAIIEDPEATLLKKP